MLLAATAVLVVAGCASNPDGCPRAGLDSARRCKRLCVIGQNQGNRPLPCTCSDDCLCWEMAGHPRRPEPPEAELGRSEFRIE